MPLIMRTRARWSGFSGAPGYTVMHFRDFGTSGGSGADPTQESAQLALQRVGEFFSALAPQLPGAVTITTDPEVDVIEDTTGQLQSSFSVTGATIPGGVANGTFSGATGAVINWNTGAIRNGRRIRGRTFLVPLAAAVYDVDGNLEASRRTAITNAAATLANSASTPDLGVYARPSAAGLADGQWAVVTSSSVPDLAAILSSRRD